MNSSFFGLWIMEYVRNQHDLNQNRSKLKSYKILNDLFKVHGSKMTNSDLDLRHYINILLFTLPLCIKLYECHLFSLRLHLIPSLYLNQSIFILIEIFFPNHMLHFIPLCFGYLYDSFLPYARREQQLQRLNNLSASVAI